MTRRALPPTPPRIPRTPGPGLASLLLAIAALAPSPMGAAVSTPPAESASPGTLPGVAPAARTAPPAAPAPVRYEIAFPNRAHHEAEITVRYGELEPGPLELRMSRTSPGRYALHEFAKNVYGVRAVDGDGRELEIHRPDPHQWTVTGHGGEVTVSYTLFADRADGTYSGIDESHAHLNVPATFLWARGLFERPVEVTVRVPEGSGWRVATQLAATDDPHVWTAPSHHYFLDSPLEISDFDLREWTVGDQTVQVAMHHAGTAEELDRYAEHTRGIVEAYRGVYGELPRFDFGRYTFLACYLPWVSGDGMEHRNSTILTSTASLESAMTGLLGTVAHEAFHAWNVERIRPASLEPFDFEEANMSRELWFGEGFTSYYDDLALVRSGVIDTDEFARRLGGSVNAVVNAPGRRFFSPVEMSMQAPFVDAATSVDPTNRHNTFISYYTWGSVIALGLDLTLRSRSSETGGVTLDDLMREMWVRHGVTERPYDVDDVEAALASITGDPALAADFFDRYVRGTAVPDFPTLLARAGIVLRPAAPGEPLLGRARIDYEGGEARLVSGTWAGTPLYQAGVDRGDVLVSVAGRSIGTGADLEAVLQDRAPGDRVEIVFESRGMRRAATVALAEDPSLGAVTDEAAGGEVSEAEARFRTAWIGGA